MAIKKWLIYPEQRRVANGDLIWVCPCGAMNRVVNVGIRVECGRCAKAFRTSLSVYYYNLKPGEEE